MFLKPKKAVLRGNRCLRTDICGQGDLDIRTTIQGSIDVDNLVVGRKGYIDGDIVAETIRILGIVKGNIHARQVIVESGAHVEGELSYEQLSVAPRADLAAKLTPRPLLKVLRDREPVEQVLESLRAVA